MAVAIHLVETVDQCIFKNWLQQKLMDIEPVYVRRNENVVIKFVMKADFLQIKILVDPVNVVLERHIFIDAVDSVAKYGTKTGQHFTDVVGAGLHGGPVDRV